MHCSPVEEMSGVSVLDVVRKLVVSTRHARATGTGTRTRRDCLACLDHRHTEASAGPRRIGGRSTHPYDGLHGVRLPLLTHPQAHAPPPVHDAGHRLPAFVVGLGEPHPVHRLADGVRREPFKHHRSPLAYIERALRR